MPETPGELHRRVAGALRVPPVAEWDSWPFEGELRPRELRPPDPEPVITGAGGVDCPACTKGDDDYLWTDERWRWGEGAEHLHWWFIGRPEGQGQMRSSFAEIWDEVLPPTPREIWEDNLARVVRAMDG